VIILKIYTIIILLSVIIVGAEVTRAKDMTQKDYIQILLFALLPIILAVIL